jgi:trehalose 6-phosphate phosphatase
LLEQPRKSGLLLDYDGTLAPIVDDPGAAIPLDGTAEVLKRLARKFKVVGVLSGRPVTFLEPLLPASVILSGLYGLEAVRGGERLDHPFAGAWREVVDDVASSAVARGPKGMRVEAKGLSLTLHYRTHPELADAVMAWAAGQAARSGLRVRAAKMSVELHPPIKADKGTAVEELAARLTAVCFVGDDVGDLPAFDALDRLADKGVDVVRVAVVSAETPSALIDRADHLVRGPAGTLELLESLA